MELDALYALYLQHPQVQTDTRKLQPGDLFFALKGPSFNGNEFARAALDAGAAAAVIDEAEFAVEGKTFLVPDALGALQDLARHHRQQLNIPFLAITGSNGKTTTKELVSAVLSAEKRTYTTEGNLNNHIGVPLTLLKIRSDAEIAVIEMGANHRGEIASYCRIALPTHGLITNCGKAHLEGFGGEEGVRLGKGELFDHLRTHGGTAFIMQDYDYLRTMSRGIEEVHTYGTAGAEVEGEAVQSDPFLEVRFARGLQGNVRTSLVGAYNLPNVLAAAATGLHFGISEKSITAALEGYQPSNSRSQLVEKGGHRIVLDAYNANPSSMKLAIENFGHAAGDNKVLLLGAMAELGAASADEHLEVVRIIGQYQWKDVVLVGGDFLKIGHPYISFATAEEAGAWLKASGISGAQLLVKGSRSTGMEKVLQYL